MAVYVCVCVCVYVCVVTKQDYNVGALGSVTVPQLHVCTVTL